ncbi:MAG: hypothetical protein ACAI43_03090 [Phycisphaerae bacterium]
MPAKPHILVDGLPVGSGGGYTVARELYRHVALARSDWRVTIRGPGERRARRPRC